MKIWAIALAGLLVACGGDAFRGTEESSLSELADGGETTTAGNGQESPSAALEEEPFEGDEPESSVEDSADAELDETDETATDDETDDSVAIVASDDEPIRENREPDETDQEAVLMASDDSADETDDSIRESSESDGGSSEPVEDYPAPLVSSRWFQPSPVGSTSDEVSEGLWHVTVTGWDGQGRSDAATSFTSGSHTYDEFAFYACGWSGGALRVEVMSAATIGEGKNLHFGVDFSPTEEWSEYRIRWEDLQPHPDSEIQELDQDMVQWVAIRLMDGTWYDLWLSKVEFLEHGQPYEGARPTGNCPR